METTKLLLYVLAGFLAVTWIAATIMAMVLLGTPA